MDSARKLEIARSRALMDFPFFGHLLLSMEIVRKDEIPTFATDGRSIFYNDDFLNTLSMDDIQFVLLHEVMHPAFFHVTRRGHRDPTLWNIAGDYVINYQLVDEGMKPPEDVLYDKKYDFNWNTDAVYNDILEGNNPNISIQSLDDMPCTGHFTDMDGEGEGKKQEMENEWKQKILSAANSCTQRGSVPGAFKEIIDEIRNPKVSWADELAELAREPMRDEHSWKRPQRKFIADELYLPSIQKIDGLRKIIFAVDTSGSMNTDILIQAWSEIVSVAQDCDVDEIIIMDVDTEVQNIHRFQALDIPEALNVVGRGGTAFEPAFDWVVENDESPCVLIYLTDLYGSFPSYEPDYPVIWVNYGDEETSLSVPFGDVINVENSGE